VKYHIPQALVTGQEKKAESTYLLSFHAPEIAKDAQPGQFVHIKTIEAYDPLLRRPISICYVDREKGLVVLWYQVVGKGTKLLSSLKTGDSIDVIGPLGRGFDTAISGEKIYLIGGGIGIAPLIFLAQSLKEENNITAFFGGKNKEQLLPVNQLTSINCELATEDGSIGHQGFVTDLLLRRLALEKPARAYACGPNGMLEQTALITRKHNLPLQVSLESVMACGVGACLGCTCEKGSSGEEGWVKVCKEGPVFWEDEVKLL